MNFKAPIESTPCAPCVARLHSPGERLHYMRERLRDETDPLVALTHLLQLCRDEHSVLWAQAADPDIRSRVISAIAPVRAIASTEAQTPLGAPLRAALVNALAVDDVAAVSIARGLAQLLDECFRGSLAASFRRRSPYRPAVGDPIPLGGPDIRKIIEMRPTAPPWRLANRLDETRHIRLAGEWATQFQVVFDYTHFHALQGIITPDTIVATCHPNRSLEEFRLPSDPTDAAFPVGPLNPRRQHRLIDALIGQAVHAGASIVVLPELCLTPSLARSLRLWTRREGGPQLLIAGSYHHLGAAPARRRNTATAWVRGHRRPMTHDKHSPAEHPINEDIQPQGFPELRIHVSADGWHLVIAICRDLLNPQAVHTLAEAGANLILAPAMSERLTPFTGQIAHLVSSGQALVAVANNPAEWNHAGHPEPHHPARALFGHPGLGQQTRLVAAPDIGPGIATMHIGSASISWAQAPSATRSAQHRNASPAAPLAPLPPWAVSLADTLHQRYHALGQRLHDPVTLRPAAVLVLLTEGTAGLQVTLTERAADLTDYPGRLTFPGGGQDAADNGPVATALREAAEEIGLQSDSVYTLGILPSMTDPESKFLVTPVLAWSSHPQYSGALNVAEVTCLRHVPLSQLSARHDDEDLPAMTCRPDSTQGHRARLGVLTAAVLDSVAALLSAHHPA
ncbi:NUDIX domain-containing protein [Mycolicibacterium pallens]|nr:NUDIX domain-containing protein [Mycolicibacterium pallens]